MPFMLIGHSTQIYHIENDMYTFIRVSLYFITLKTILLLHYELVKHGPHFLILAFRNIHWVLFLSYPGLVQNKLLLRSKEIVCYKTIKSILKRLRHSKNSPLECPCPVCLDDLWPCWSFDPLVTSPPPRSENAGVVGAEVELVEYRGTTTASTLSGYHNQSHNKDDKRRTEYMNEKDN